MLSRVESLRGDWKPLGTDRLKLPNERICIAANMNIPNHDETLLAEMLERCKEYEIQSIIWLGNLIGKCPPSSRLLSILRGVVGLASDVVPIQYWIRGPYEDKWIRLDNGIYLEQLAAKAHLGMWVANGTLILEDGKWIDVGTNWLIGHPYNQPGHPFSFASKLTSHKQKNVLVASSRWGMMAVDNFVAVESGNMCTPENFNGVNGYWFLIDSEPVGFRKDTN